MQTAASVTIERPIDEVFDFTVNHVAEWSVVVESDEIIDEKPEGVGTTFRVVTRGHGCRMEFDGLVTRHVRPALHTVVMKGKQFDIEADYSFEEHHGLRYTDRALRVATDLSARCPPHRLRRSSCPRVLSSP